MFRGALQARAQSCAVRTPHRGLCVEGGWPAWSAPVSRESLPALPGQAEAIVFSDGAARGNPGLGGAGAFIVSRDCREVLGFAHRHLGPAATNNTAEYEVRCNTAALWRSLCTFRLAWANQAVKLGLELAHESGLRSVAVLMDSKLVACQRE